MLILPRVLFRRAWPISFADAVTTQWPLVLVLPGANGGAPDLAKLLMDGGKDTRFEVIGYPGWSHYVADGYSARALVTYLADKIEIRTPRGPIRIVGISIGGHLGYAAALELQARGHEIGGFCAIDTFMTSSSAPDPGWLGRATAQGASLIGKWRPGEFAHFLRSRLWRALLRIGGDRLPNLLKKVSPSGRFAKFIGFDPLFIEELNMRLLIRQINPWVPSLDRGPVELRAPASLLRTRSNIRDDAAWRHRCPNIDILDVSGDHHSLFEEENVSSLRRAFVVASRAWSTKASTGSELRLSMQATMGAGGEGL